MSWKCPLETVSPSSLPLLVNGVPHWHPGVSDRETPVGDLRVGGERDWGIYSTGATTWLPPPMILEWLCSLQLQFLSGIPSMATGFASGLGC